MLNARERREERRAMQKEWREEQECEKYCLLLLTRKLRLWEVPEQLRRSPTCADSIYIAGFRADRMVSRARYEEDLTRLAVEVTLVEVAGKAPELLRLLKKIQARLEDNLRLFDIYDISDFH